MPRVPQFNRTVSPEVAKNEYINSYATPEAFGLNVTKAKAQLGDAAGNFIADMEKIKDRIDDTKILGLSNYSQEWEQKNLYDKDNGYYYKMGQDAYGQSEVLLKNYNDYMNDYIKKSNLSPYARKRAEYVLSHMRSRIESGITNHDYKQGIVWADNEAETNKNNYLNSAINQRNNPEEMKKCLGSALQAIEFQGEIKHLDRSAVELEKKKFISSAHEAILGAYLSEGSLKASEYFEQHKAEINPDKLPRYIDAVKDNELKYNSLAIAQNIITNTGSEQDAMIKAQEINDPEMADMVISRINKYYNRQEQIENLQRKDMLESFYNNALSSVQNGRQLSYDDIPIGLDAETKLGLMNYINKNGSPDTDNQVWENLYNMSINNAQGFAQEDLNKYRGFLSDGEYKSFLKKQEEIKNGEFYTQIKDDDKMIKAALVAMGMKSDGKQDSAFSEIRSMVREFEARKGRSITDDELMNITKSLGYKGEDGKKLYQQLEKGMAKRTGFIKDVINDFTYYQNQHNGQMPSDEEKYKIIMKRVQQEKQEQKSAATITIDNYKNNSFAIRNIDNVVSKPNEQKVLTYFADTQIPYLSKNLGIKLTVTSRYRNQPGSHHYEGRAADVSMSEHSSQNRVKIYEKLLSLPTVHKIGTSDPVILTHFAGNKKIVDERSYDKQHGTNHVNHAHVTLINYNPQNKPQQVAKNNNIYSF